MCRKAPTWPNRATLECPDPFSKQSNPLFRIFFTLAGGSSGMHIWTKVTSLSVSARTGNRFEFKFTNSRKRWGGRFEYQPNPPQGPPLARRFPRLPAHKTTTSAGSLIQLHVWLLGWLLWPKGGAWRPPPHLGRHWGHPGGWLVAKGGIGWPPMVGKGLFRVIC